MYGWTIQGPVVCGPHQTWGKGATRGRNSHLHLCRSNTQLLPICSVSVANDEVLMVSATEVFQMSHIGLGHLGVLSMVPVNRVGGNVDMRGEDWCRAGA